MIRTQFFASLLYGLIKGNTLSSIKALNRSSVKESWYISHVKYPSTVITGQIDHLFDLLFERITRQGHPRGDHPLLLSAVLLLAADSSTKTI